MYELYEQKCGDVGRNPVLKHSYREIFNFKFNIEFRKPKKDRCDLCYQREFFPDKFVNNDEKEQEYCQHISSKEATYAERKADRALTDPSIVTMCIDLQKTFNLPKATVSNFYYKSKLCVYNLMALFDFESMLLCDLSRMYNW